ncbi:hypothetical protein GCM10027578_24050 [Spirosoma luteolum]
MDQSTLRAWLAARIPEAETNFMALSDNVSLYITLYKLFEVTDELARQHRFRAVKRCLLAAESLLLSDNRRCSNAVCTIYVYHLSMVLDTRDNRAEVIHYLMPPGLQAEYHRQLAASLP